MAEELACYRCGASLAALSLPLSRRDACPQCAVHVHVCRMCRSYDPAVPKQCREDDAEAVHDKESANFCDWFEPRAGAFDHQRAAEAERAGSALAALLGDGGDIDSPPDESARAAEDLFK